LVDIVIFSVYGLIVMITIFCIYLNPINNNFCIVDK
jgi:hypothetical protein